MPLKLKYILISVFLLGVWCLHVYDKHKAVESVKTSIEATYNKKLLDAAITAQELQNKMQAEANKAREDKDAKIKEIDSQLSVAISELRKRPKRPTNDSKGSTDTKACTASSLYSEDAEFLAREAARADSILLERDYYFNEYESVRRRLDEASNK